MLNFRVLIIVGLFAFAQLEEVKYKECTDSHASKNCQIHRLVVNPCPEAATNKGCVLKKQTTASIQVDLTTTANVNDLTTKAFWATSAADLPLVGMDTEACKYMTCPTTGQQQMFNYTLPINKNYPSARYLVKWRIWKEDEVECCFLFRIKIEK